VTMTRKNYVLIASALSDARSFVEQCNEGPGEVATAKRTEATLALVVATERLADALALDNERFDRQRFIAACRAGD
jgi:hypothetical protein